MYKFNFVILVISMALLLAVSAFATTKKLQPQVPKISKLASIITHNARVEYLDYHFGKDYNLQYIVRDQQVLFYLTFRKDTCAEVQKKIALRITADMALMLKHTGHTVSKENKVGVISCYPGISVNDTTNQRVVYGYAEFDGTQPQPKWKLFTYNTDYQVK